tara:strand:+ start:812 stop:1321 length:510 start_codon:yes stop_codon:yes gene_type:complete
MLEIINNYDIVSSTADNWTKISSLATVGAVIAALGMHWHSEYKRDKNSKITKIEESITFLKCILEELNLNKVELVNIKISILDIKKDLDDKNKKIFSYYDTKYCKEISSFYDGNTSYLMKLDNPQAIEYIIKSYNNLSNVYNLLRYVQSRTLETKDVLTLHLDKTNPRY